METVQIIVEIFGMIALPAAGWALAQIRAERKTIADKEADIARLREVRDTVEAQANETAHTDMRKTCAELTHTMERTTKAIYDMRIEIAQQYATMIALRETETRFFGGLKRLEDKLDRILEARA